MSASAAAFAESGHGAFPRSRRILPEQGKTGCPAPRRQAGHYAFSGTTGVQDSLAAFGSPAGPPEQGLRVPARHQLRGQIRLSGPRQLSDISPPRPEAVGACSSIVLSIAVGSALTNRKLPGIFGVSH
jgi:hypothetical protein